MLCEATCVGVLYLCRVWRAGEFALEDVFSCRHGAHAAVVDGFSLWHSVSLLRRSPSLSDVERSLRWRAVARSDMEFSLRWRAAEVVPLYGSNQIRMCFECHPQCLRSTACAGGRCQGCSRRHIGWIQETGTELKCVWGGGMSQDVPSHEGMSQDVPSVGGSLFNCIVF